MVRHLARALGALAPGGALLGTLGALGCCGAAILGLGGASALLGSGVVGVPASWSYEVLYASLGLTLVALAANARRHRRPSGLVAGLVGVVALLLAFHEAWDVRLFRLLVWTGAAALLAAVAFDVRGLHGCRTQRGA